MLLEECTFGVEAIAYVDQQLSSGDTFAKYLRTSLQIENGSVISYLPNTVVDKQRQDFEHSIAITTGYNMTDAIKSKITALITEYLGERRGRYVVFETLARKDDQWLKLKNFAYFLYQTEVYGFVSHEKSDIQHVLDGLKCARDYPFVCALTSLSESDIVIAPNQQIAADVLHSLASEADCILIGAYDAEGYLIWKKPGFSLTY